MTAAAVALAAALLVWPATPRRLRAVRRSRIRRGPVLPVGLVAAGVLLWTIPGTAALAAGMIAGTGWLRWRRRRMMVRRKEEADALQAALGVLVGELRVGAHPVSAFSTAAAEVSGPVADGMRTVAARGRLGADVAAGLDDIARSSVLPVHWQRLAVCWRLAEHHGLAIATLMRTAQQDIVERERFSARVHAGMAGARATAVVLAGLPVVGIGLGQLIGADPVSFLTSGGGGWLLVIGVLLSCAGLLWSDRIAAGVVK
ncbi:type II secretion system F family protein [Mycolicibacterium sp.]|uniref:type II secretion system F family protein n=1 Tax=Mycolicibacterium sp. TaxID=2320850 RepID=UPI0037C57BD6